MSVGAILLVSVVAALVIGGFEIQIDRHKRAAAPHLDFHRNARSIQAAFPSLRPVEAEVVRRIVEGRPKVKDGPSARAYVDLIREGAIVFAGDQVLVDWERLRALDQSRQAATWTGGRR